MRPLMLILLTAVLALFGACPTVPAALGDVLGLVFGGVAAVFTQPALLLLAFGLAAVTLARRARGGSHGAA